VLFPEFVLNFARSLFGFLFTPVVAKMSSGLSEGLRSVIKKATEEIETSESCEEWEEKLSNAGILSIEVFLHYLRIAGHIPFGMDRKFLNTILDFAQQRGEASDDDRIHIMTLEFPEGEAAKAAKLVRKKRQSETQDDLEGNGEEGSAGAEAAGRPAKAPRKTSRRRKAPPSPGVGSRREGQGECPHGRVSSCWQCPGGTAHCLHGKRPDRCKDCGGSGVCEHGILRLACKKCSASKNRFCDHGRQKYSCKECGGAGVCIHGRLRHNCKECGGKRFCQHGKHRYTCKECGGGGICVHGKVRQQCKSCKSTPVCDHGRDRYLCKQCRPSCFCDHGRLKFNCRECQRLNIFHFAAESPNPAPASAERANGAGGTQTAGLNGTATASSTSHTDIPVSQPQEVSGAETGKEAPSSSSSSSSSSAEGGEGGWRWWSGVDRRCSYQQREPGIEKEGLGVAEKWGEERDSEKEGGENLVRSMIEGEHGLLVPSFLSSCRQAGSFLLSICISVSFMQSLSVSLSISSALSRTPTVLLVKWPERDACGVYSSSLIPFDPMNTELSAAHQSEDSTVPLSPRKRNIQREKISRSVNPGCSLSVSISFFPLPLDQQLSKLIHESVNEIDRSVSISSPLLFLPRFLPFPSIPHRHTSVPDAAANDSSFLHSFL